MPEQIKRLSFVFIALIILFIIFRRILVPVSFGQFGYYRALSIKDIISKDMKYAGEAVCSECHDDIMEIKKQSYHKNVRCEVCHKPAYNHSQAPDEYKPSVPRKRSYCTLCHSYDPSRPTGFPQINSVTHNPGKSCVSCHNPHTPTPPSPPKECSPCHTQIARLKIVSPHVSLSCTECHKAREEHKIYPRQYPPTKPTGREFCGKCHAKSSVIAFEVPKIDMETHNPDFMCWDCHYPHYPEFHLKKEERW